MKRWRQLKKIDRMRILFIAVALIVGFYGLIIYPGLQESVIYSEGLISRRVDRIEKRTKTDKELGVNPAPLYKDLDKLEKALELIDLRRQQAEQKFVSLLDYGAQQQLQFEIVDLARKTGFILERISKPESSDHIANATGSEGKTPEKNYSQRPLIKLDAAAGYWSLVNFLEGLQSLSYYSAVTKLKIEMPRSSKLEKTVQNTGSNRLLIHMEMIF